MKTLRISKGLSLPVDFVSQSAAILARKRAGKSYTARKLVEQLMKAGEQVIIIDPKGDWHGILSSADGKSAGYPVTIFGGEHQHVPLEVRGGELVAKIAVEERLSMLLDLSEFRKHEVATFSTDFLETLYRLKAKEANRTTVMLVVDEADAIAPQKPMPNEARMLGAISDVVRRGGQRGLGCLLITQRSAVLSKDVLTQTQVLVAMKTIAPQDLEAIEAWVNVHGTVEQRKTLMASLPSLPVGEGWFWSPGWPTDAGVFQRVKIDPIETFDSGATPKPGEKRIKPKKVAAVDIVRMRSLMAETIERAKADDPKELKKRIAELEKAAKKLPQSTTESVNGITLGEFEVVIDRRDLENILQSATDMEEEFGTLNKAGARLQDVSRALSARVHRARLTGSESLSKRLKKAPTPEHSAAKLTAPSGLTPRQRAVRATASVGGTRDPSIGDSGLCRMLIALAQNPGGLTRRRLGLMAGVSSKSGTFSTYLSRARAGGWIDGKSDISITGSGLAALGHYTPLPEGDELRNYWLREIGDDSGAARMLRVLAEAYPEALSRAVLGERADISSASGTFSTYLSRLRGLELVEGKSEIKLSEELVG